MNINELEDCKLGKGAFGEVYQFISHLNKQAYALKNIQTTDERIKNDALNEFKLMKELSKCPHVI